MACPVATGEFRRELARLLNLGSFSPILQGFVQKLGHCGEFGKNNCDASGNPET